MVPSNVNKVPGLPFTLSFFLSSCTVQSRFCRGTGDVYVPLPQNQKQITCHEACVTFLSTAALPHRRMSRCFTPEMAGFVSEPITHPQQRDRGDRDAHTRCHRKQDTRPVGEIGDREKDGRGIKLRKGKRN